MGVRPTQLTIKHPAFQSLGLIMICSKIYKICINVEMCEMCRPDTHALMPAIEASLKTDSWNDDEGHFATWISESSISNAKWAKALVRQWLEKDVVKQDPRVRWFYSSERLANASLRMDAISSKDLVKISETIRNKALVRALREIAEKYGQ